MIVLLAMVALAIDSGNLLVARAELQRSADAAAMAATWELLDQQVRAQPDGARLNRVAAEYAAMNKVGNVPPELDLTAIASPSGDVFYGCKANPTDQECPLTIGNLTEANATKVRVVRSNKLNGEVSLFFGGIFNKRSQAAEATGEAAFLRNFRGFKIPDSEPRTVPVLPFALDHSAWYQAQEGVGTDQYTWDEHAEAVHSGADGKPEIHLYPIDGNAPGNFGTLNIGNHSGNGALRRQILEGANQGDLGPYGGQLALDSSGELLLGGMPGMRSTLGTQLEAVIGQPRIIPLYSSVSGSGSQAQYTIIGFGCARVMAVKLQGSNKHVAIQPAALITRGGIPGDPNSQTSHNIYSPVMLTR